MPPQNNPRVHILRFGLRGWAAIGEATVVLVAVAVLALGLFVLFLPILLLAPVLYYFLPRPKGYSLRRQQPKDSTIIEGEFRMIDSSDIEKNANTIRDKRDH
jgi:hypothetical protein